MSKQEKLEKLAEIEGYPDTMAMLEANVIESVTPGICTNEGCDYSTETEPDSSTGWCEECQTNTVASCMMLSGLI